MPLRGSLFKKLFATTKEREKIEKKQLVDHFKKQGKELTKIRKKRIEEEGRANLRELLRKEKSKLNAAKSRGRTSRFEGFLAKEAKSLARSTGKFALKEAKKRAARARAGKPIFGKNPKRKKKKNKGRR